MEGTWIWGDKRSSQMSTVQARSLAVQVVGLWEGTAGMAFAVLILEYKFREDRIIFIFIEALIYRKVQRTRTFVVCFYCG